VEPEPGVLGAALVERPLGERLELARHRLHVDGAPRLQLDLQQLEHKLRALGLAHLGRVLAAAARDT
jgi:hypothetical protein